MLVETDENIDLPFTTKKITAGQVIDRIKTQCGTGWKDSQTDIFNTGNQYTLVTGITTSFTPSFEVLKKSVAAGNNLIITQQPSFYGQTEEYLQHDPAFHFKKDFIEKNSLVIWRFYDNWNSRKVDGQLLGLAKSLGWDKYHIQNSAEEAYFKENKYFMLPESTLADKVTEIENKLKIPAIRVIGYPGIKIKKAALSHDMFKLSELRQFLKDPEVDLIIIAEAIEWEACEYFRDILTWKGKNRAMILIGREASEDPGYGEVALWLTTFIPEVPVKWIPSNEPFWVP